MSERMKAAVLVVAVSCAGLGAPGCTGGGTPADDAQTQWEALMTDGDPESGRPRCDAAADDAAAARGRVARFCPGDCSGSPLALWTFDDCSMAVTNLADSAFTSQIPHPAFRAVSAACVPGIAGAAVKLADDEDIVYSPDQPDYLFDQGLTVAARIKPDWLGGTQSIIRKRFDGASSFVLGIEGKEAGARAQAHEREDRRRQRGRVDCGQVHARRRHLRR